MDCRAAAFSNEYYDFIAEYGVVHGLALDENTCTQQINDRYSVVYISRARTRELNLTNFSYLAIPDCFGPLDTGALEASGILKVQAQPTFSLKGEGVMIGFLDSGITYEDPLFRNSDGSSRIEAVWDQTVEDGTPPPGYIYGQEYRREILNEALASEDPQKIVPLVDESGHGTYMVSLAAGNADIGKDFSGAAPLATIAVVKLKQAKPYIRDYYFIDDKVDAYMGSDVMAAVEYLDQLAASLDMPLVICIGLGSNYGGHTGSGPLSTMLSQFAARGKRGIVIAAGNEASSRLHYSGSDMETDKDELVEINVGQNVRGFTAELWAKTPDVYSVEIISPTGERLPRSASRSGTRAEHLFVFENTRVSVEYRISDITNGQQLIFMRFDNPIQGIWNIRVFGDSIVRGGYNMWLTFSGFLTGSVFFIRSNPDVTVTQPGTARLPITVGAYNAADNSIYIRSGRGFLPGGEVKPDFVAPGVDLMGASPHGALVSSSGTSGAAAITAGAVALVLEWAVLKEGNDYINSIVIKYLLIRGTTRDTGRTYPNEQWGYGKLNLFEAFNEYRIT